MPLDIFALLARADELYRQRASVSPVRESVTLLTGSEDGAKRFEVQWRLARSLFFLGQQAGSRGAKLQLHASGVGAGLRAVELSPDRVESRFWLGVNHALFAEAATGLRAARAVIHARRELKRAASLEEGYHGAGPLRVLGRLEHKAPWFIGGSRKRSREYFDRALALAPTNSVTALYAAELAADSGEPDEAARLLKIIIDAPVDPEWEFENLRDRKRAVAMLERLRERQEA